MDVAQDKTVFHGSRICIVGNICRDVKNGPLSPDGGLFEDGETPTRRISETIGGGGANSAVSQPVSPEVRFAGKTGADALGLQLEQR